ncbi:alpha/beta fold hydrolase [Goodfellowiella coeruleoviolacea]|uniref:alpha/beta fold hydrolase n=1 Tax=Goodfellowiella coeruleoviolacea TaxID=334858 RepID=UPI00389927B1
MRWAGPADAPGLVLVHGWAQSGDVWRGLLADPRLTDRYRVVAVDLRGHGDSDVPDAATGYADSADWAADVAAVLAWLGRPSVLVGWSYGGLVLTDHLRVHGTSGVAGLALVGALTEMGRGRQGGWIGPSMRRAGPPARAEDPAVAVPALLELVTGMSASPLPGADVQRLLAAALRVPPAVRAALVTRQVDSAEVLAAVDVPTLVLHGTEDTVVDPAAGRYALSQVPGARAHWFTGVGHLPFVERPEEFTAALADFTAECLDRVGTLP